MNRLALGTVQFGLPYGIANQDGQVSRSTAKTIVEFADANGIDTLDTAIAYGDSEACLGEIGVSDFKIVTKLPGLPDQCSDVAAWVEQQLLSSLVRLGTTRVYGLLLHRPDQLFGEHGIALYRALQHAKGLGQTKKIGLSIYDPRELELLPVQYHFDLVQGPLNLIDRRFATSGWLHKLADSGIEVHTRSAFMQGLLLIPPNAIPSRFARWESLWLRWHKWLSGQDVAALDACLAYSLSFPEIDRVVIGVDSLSQLDQVVAAASRSFMHEYPDIQCDDILLINPAKWPSV